MRDLKIGIIGYKTGDNSFGAGVNHLEFISKFGTPVIIMPNDSPEELNLDILYLPGGMDLRPSSYGQVPGFRTSATDVHKQHFFDTQLDYYIENDIPIFAVCLGFQMLCAKFGLKLIQDLPFHPQSSGRWDSGHSILPVSEVYRNAPLTTIENPLFHDVPVVKKGFKVNSHHHQGACISNVDNDLDFQPILVSETFDCIEAAIHKTKPIVGVQWHPEEFYDRFSQTCFRALCDHVSDTHKKLESAASH